MRGETDRHSVQRVCVVDALAYLSVSTAESLRILPQSRKWQAESRERALSVIKCF